MTGARWLLSRFLLALALFFPYSAQASGSVGGGCQENLDTELRRAVDNFDVYPDLFPNRPNLTAKRFAVSHASCIDDLIKLAELSNLTRLSPARRKAFVADLEWARALFADDMGEIYRQFKYFDGLNDDGDGIIIGSHLYRWLMDHGYPPIEFDTALGYGTHDGALNVRRIREVAERGYAPAILDIARRALIGDGVERNRGEAWYWLKRAQQQGADIALVTQMPLQRMLEDMNEQERQTLTHMADYHDDLDLNGIDIPASFAPPFPDVPPPLSDKEVETFKEEFRRLLGTGDKVGINVAERELVSRTAGIRQFGSAAIDAQTKPLGMKETEFIRRKCNYHRAGEKIFPQGRDEQVRELRAKEAALSSFFDKDSSRYVRDVVRAGRICPNRESAAISAGLIWAKELEKQSPSALGQLAARHFEQSGSGSRTKFDPGAEGGDPDSALEAYWHFRLGRSLQDFASYVERASSPP